MATTTATLADQITVDESSVGAGQHPGGRQSHQRGAKQPPDLPTDVVHLRAVGETAGEARHAQRQRRGRGVVIMVRRTERLDRETGGEKFFRGRVDPRAARSTCGCECEGRAAAPPDEESAMSKYMLIMRGTDESNAAMMASIEEGIARTRLFIEEMMKAGVLLGAEGLDDPGKGAVVDFSGEAPVVTDGPYGETRELFGGFFLLDVASKQEAVEWAKRVPAAPGSKIEVRRVPEEDEVPQDSTVQS
jgi:hypothetical protein